VAKQNATSDAPLTVTGCLQQGGRNTYVVTRLNEPAQKNAGSAGNGAAVEREQLRAAANAYRIEPKGKLELETMVGKQVRVSGTLDEIADLPPASGSGSSGSGSAGSNDRKESIDTGNLAKLNATSASVVAENCGGSADARR